MNIAKFLKDYHKAIGCLGGKKGRGPSKARTGTSENMKKYWEDVLAGRKAKPGRRPLKKDDPVTAPELIRFVELKLACRLVRNLETVGDCILAYDNEINSFPHRRSVRQALIKRIQQLKNEEAK